MAIWLDVPYSQKEEAKNLGASWSVHACKWRVPDGVDPDRFAKWLPKPQPERPAPKPVAATRAPELFLRKKVQSSIWLCVPFNQKDLAKLAGAKWDASERRWFVPEGADRDLFARWLPAVDETEGSGQTVQPVHEIDPRWAIAKGVQLALLKHDASAAYESGVSFWRACKGRSRWEGWGSMPEVDDYLYSLDA